MKKTALGIAVAIVGVAVAGAWYTGSRVEEEINRGINQANVLLEEQAPTLGAYITLLEFKRGVFSSQARYSLTFTGDDPTEPQTLIFSDRLEHGPFPLSRLASGKLLPVMAQSHFALERNELSARLFTAAGDKTPFFGDINMHYDQSVSGTLETAELALDEGVNALKSSPAKLRFSLSQDQKDLTLDGTLEQLTLSYVDAGMPSQLQVSGLEFDLDKKESQAGFAIGPSFFSIANLKLTSAGSPEVELRDTWLKETLQSGSKGLDQKVDYRVEKLLLAGQEIGSLKLVMSLNNLNEKAMRRFEDELDKMVQQGLDESDLSMADELQLQRLSLDLLDSEPQFAIDELLLKTSNGQASAALTVNMRKPNGNVQDMDELVRDALSSLKADIKIDKAVIGDIAALQLLAEYGPDGLAPEEIKQHSAMLTEMFSGMALGSKWVVLNDNTLSSEIDYSNDKVTLNGQSMSVPEFFMLLGPQQQELMELE